jgi:hypothetical protein
MLSFFFAAMKAIHLSLSLYHFKYKIFCYFESTLSRIIYCCLVTSISIYHVSDVPWSAAVLVGWANGRIASILYNA